MCGSVLSHGLDDLLPATRQDDVVPVDDVAGDHRSLLAFDFSAGAEFLGVLENVAVAVVDSVGDTAYLLPTVRVEVGDDFDFDLLHWS